MKNRLSVSMLYVITHTHYLKVMRCEKFCALMCNMKRKHLKSYNLYPIFFFHFLFIRLQRNGQMSCNCVRLSIKCILMIGTVFLFPLWLFFSLRFLLLFCITWIRLLSLVSLAPFSFLFFSLFCQFSHSNEYICIDFAPLFWKRILAFYVL